MRVKLAGVQHLADSFILRTPLLPVDDLLGWSDGSEPSGDGEVLRHRLRELVRRPEVRSALHASLPDSEERLAAWLQDPTTAHARRFERQLVWYLTRMSTRPTPFGLFAGVSAGSVGGRTSLLLDARGAYRLRSCLDMGVLLRVVDDLLADPALVLRLVWRPNSTLYALDGCVRYVEARDGAHRLVEVQDSTALRAVLQHARRGRTGQDLAERLAADGHDLAAARGYVQTLACEQVLAPDLAPALTGPPPAETLLDSLAGLAGRQRLSADLGAVTGALRQADAAGVAGCLEYHDRAATLAATLAGAERPRAAVHVDLYKPMTTGQLGDNVVADLARGVEVLHRITPQPPDPLAAFAAAFTDRFGAQPIELCQALDEIHGIGFRQHPAPADPNDLLAELSPDGAQAEPHPNQQLHQARPALLALLSEALTKDRHELVLTEADLDALSLPARPLPASFAVTATLAAPGGRAADRGDFTILLRSVSGPPAIQPFGRFCHAEQLRAIADRHLQLEEASHPEAIFAEIVHLSEPGHANVLLRPCLRAYEIPYLARSGAPADRQLAVTDLLVGVRDRQVTLWSKTHRREVIPRLSVAHNHPAAPSSTYRFLAALAQHRVAGSLAWRWGPLAHSVFLPRVRWRRIVLAHATWRLPASRLAALLPLQHDALRAQVGKLQAELGLPRLVALVEGNRELVIDLDNSLSVRAIAHRARRHTHAVLVEVFPDPDMLCVTGPEGTFTHELIVPFTRIPLPPNTPTVNSPATNRPPPWQAGPPGRRHFLPGSAWATIKVYANALELDRLLAATIPALIERLDEHERIGAWHFLRYGDPQWHLRLRVRLREPRALLDMLEAARATLGSAVEDGLVHRVELGTYQREVERYGGPAGIALAERLFEVDSAAVLRLLRGGGSDQAVRWRLALLGMHRWLADFGLSLAHRRDLCHAASGSLHRDVAQRLGALYRREGRHLWQLIATDDPGGNRALATGSTILRVRSAQAAPTIAALVASSRRGDLSIGLADYARSIVHLHVNRMMVGSGSLYESALYALLDRLYARAQAQPSTSAPGAGSGT